MNGARPTRVGAYTIVEVLGEGGMGVVYLAEQSDPVRRTVALKMLKQGTDSAQVLARFEAERQALAVMDHPAIAKIFDAGVTDDGRSYFVMERVHGEPIDRYCDGRTLPVRERVSLFMQVCRAVQHAHQKGVIHRDLKPSNILVADVDGEPQPRIIDFGIAKAARESDFDDPNVTRDDQVVGTPAYMSPEQIGGSGDIDTRSDIYSLGVVLYELLAGALPFDRSAYKGWAAVAAVLTTDPPTPSRRLAELGDTRKNVARHRGTSVPALRGELSGDLDWIVGRAIEKDRGRRYETANGLALDLERYLAHEPVRARGASAAYRIRKFVRRNRIGVAFAATVVAGLVVFSVVTAVQAERVARARDEAEARRAQAEDLIDFMLGDLRTKLEPLGRLDILDDIGGRAVGYFATLPADAYSDEELASRSQALHQIGQVRLSQGRTEEAEPAFIESLRLARELSERHPEDGERLFDLGQSQFWVGSLAFRRGEMDEAQEAFEAYRNTSLELVERDPTNPGWQLELSYSHTNLGIVYNERGFRERALGELEASLEAKQRILEATPDDPALRYDVSQGHFNLASALEDSGRLREARDHLERDAALKLGLIEDQPENTRWPARLLVTRGRLARIVEALGDSAEALRLEQAQWAAAQRLMAHDPANTTWRRDGAVARATLGEHLARVGRTAEGFGHLDGAVDDLSRLLSDDPENSTLPVSLGRALGFRARARLEAGRLSAARDDVDRMLPLVQDAYDEQGGTGPTPLALAEALRLRGDLAAASARPEAAARAWEEAVAVSRRAPGFPAEWRPARLAAETLLKLGRADEARPLMDRLQRQGVRIAPAAPSAGSG